MKLLEHRVCIESIHEEFSLAVPPQQIDVVLLERACDPFFIFINLTERLLDLANFDLTLGFFFLIDFRYVGLQSLLSLHEHISDRVVQYAQLPAVALCLKFHQLHMPLNFIL